MGEKDGKIVNGEGDNKKMKGEEKVEGKKKKKKPAAAGGGKEDGLIIIILKLDLHCEGCAQKVRLSIHNYDGVEEVNADYAGGILTVKGNVDPNWLRGKVEHKTNKNVQLLSHSSSHPNNKKTDHKLIQEDKSQQKLKGRNKPEDKKPNHQAHSTTTVLKIPLHCDGCAHKIKRIIKKIDGVKNVSVDNDKDLVTLEGSMDTKQLTPYLKEKLKRSVDIFSPKKEDGAGKSKNGKESTGEKKEKTATSGATKKEKAGDENKDKKDKASGGSEGVIDKKDKASDANKDKNEKPSTDGGGKKEKESGGDGDGGGSKKEKEGGKGGTGGKEGGGGDSQMQVDESKDSSSGGDKGKGKLEEVNVVEVSKMEYQGHDTPYTYNYALPLYNQSYANQDYPLYNQSYANQDYGLHTMQPVYHASTSYIMGHNDPYHHHQHFHQPQMLPPPPPLVYFPPPQDHDIVFDETPEACSVM